jgi:TP901 family phage tail tape measure protein
VAELKVRISADVSEGKKLVRTLKEIKKASGGTAGSLAATSKAAQGATVALSTTVSASGQLATTQNLAAVANVAVAKTLGGVAAKAAQVTLAERVATAATNTLASAFARLQTIGSSAFLKVGAGAKRFGMQMRTAAATTVGASTAAVGLGATLAIGLGTGIKSAVEFEKTLSRVEGLVGVAKSEVEAFKKPLLDIGKATAKGPNELAEALFFVTSAGFKGGDALDVLEASAKAAAAGLGETKDVADAVTSAVNAYGIENLSAAQSTDILVAAVREGKAAADEIGQAIGQVLPIASQLDVTFDQVGATIAALTRVGLNAAESATALKATLNTLSKPGDEAVETLKRLSVQNLGVEKTFDDVRKVLSEDGLIAALNLLQDATGGNTQELQKIFPNIRAGAGVFSLLGKNAKDVEGIFDRMKDTVGATDKAFEAYKNTTSFELNEALVVLQVSLQRVGEVLLPAVAKAFVTLTSAVEGTVNLFDGLGKAIAEAISGPDDPYIRALNNQKALNDAVDDYEQGVKRITGYDDTGKAIFERVGAATGALDKAAFAFTRSLGSVAGVELDGSFDEQLAALRKARDAAITVVEQLEREKKPLVVAKNAADDLSDVLEEIVVTAQKRTTPIDEERLKKGKSALSDLRSEVRILQADYSNLQELGQEGLGLAEDAAEASSIFNALQGKVSITEAEIASLISKKRELEEVINDVNEAFARQDAATDFLDELAMKTSDLSAQFAAVRAGGSLIEVQALQQANELFADLAGTTSHTVAELQQLILLEEAQNAALQAMDTSGPENLLTLINALKVAQAGTADDSLFAQYGMQIDALNDSLIDLALKKEGLTGLDELVLAAMPKEQQFEEASIRLKNAFNLAGIIDPEQNPEFIAAIDSLRMKIFGLTDLFADLGKATAENLQDSFSEFLFDPFSDGLDGMAKSFGDMLRKLTSDILANMLLKSFFESMAGAGGGVGSFATSALGALTSGTRAGGGPVQRDKSFLVGERGPEIFTPRQSGNIESNASMGAQSAPEVNVAGPTIVNTIDDGMIVAAFNRGGGEKTILNNMTENKAAFRQALGIGN